MPPQSSPLRLRRCRPHRNRTVAPLLTSQQAKQLGLIIQRCSGNLIRYVVFVVLVPVHAMTDCKSTLANDPAIPEITYAIRNPVFPNRRSTKGPICHSTNMLNPMWTIPMCTNIEVNRRHHSAAVTVLGPKFAPH